LGSVVLANRCEEERASGGKEYRKKDIRKLEKKKKQKKGEKEKKKSQADSEKRRRLDETNWKKNIVVTDRQSKKIKKAGKKRSSRCRQRASVTLGPRRSFKI